MKNPSNRKQKRLNKKVLRQIAKFEAQLKRTMEA